MKITLSLVPRLKGEVANPNGKAVVGATATMGSQGYDGSVTTGPNGRF